MPDKQQPKLTLLYHFFHPDDVVSARLLSETASGLAERGWNVTARPSNRTRNEAVNPSSHRSMLHGSPPHRSLPHGSLPLHENWQNVTVKRVWRPAWKQESNVGRMLNSMWMLAAWSWTALTLRRSEQEVMLVGTDPILGVLAALPWKWFRPRAKVAHWCFDLYPDAAVADKLLPANSLPTRLLAGVTRAALRRCDLVADLGECMKQRLQAHVQQLPCTTMTPWALVEPAEPPQPDQLVRQNLFGHDARLALLYSGSFGRAHSHDEFLALARQLRGTDVEFCFAGRGSRSQQLQAAVDQEDRNVHFADFAPQAELEKRLTACDIHLVSLRSEWTGTVVPSKFFGALAVGRAVLFAGSPDSAIAGWIREHRVGWVLTPDNVKEIAEILRTLADRPEEMSAIRQRCHSVYQQHFSRQRVLDRWDTELRRLLADTNASEAT